MSVSGDGILRSFWFPVGQVSFRTLESLHFSGLDLRVLVSEAAAVVGGLKQALGVVVVRQQILELKYFALCPLSLGLRTQLY